jgi:uncharacterized membrane protein
MHTTEPNTFAGQAGFEAPDERMRRFEIWPHRSLGTWGVIALLGTLMAGWAVVAFSAPSPMLWPITFGCALTFAAVAIAFGSNMRAARAREIVEIGPRDVHVHMIGSDGQQSIVSFATNWVRVQVSNDRGVHNRLTLSQSGRSIEIGAFLSPAERADLAKAIGKALTEAKGR